MSQGQINRGSILGELLYEYAKKHEVSTIVEFGTYNGLGSTRCILDGLLDSRKDTYLFYSVESNIAMFELSKYNNPTKNIGFDILYGRIVEVSELEWFDKNSLNDDQKRWLHEDITNYKICPNILDKIPISIDLLVLDGGEFSSHVEFCKLADRSKYIILDDTFATETMKFTKIRNTILNTKTCYTVIDDRPSERNGFMILENIKFHE